jgi:hypothetical protein
VDEFLSAADPSILHFLLASGEQARCAAPARPAAARPPVLRVQARAHRAVLKLLLMRACMSPLVHCAGTRPGGRSAARRPPGATRRPRAQISSKQLRDDLMTMLIAGHETTAAVLTWTLHCLAGRPDVVARLQAEARCFLPRRPAPLAAAPAAPSTARALLSWAHSLATRSRPRRPPLP